MRAGRDDLGVGAGPARQIRPEALGQLRERAAAHLIDLGQDQLVGHRHLAQHGHELEIDRLEPVPRVDQQAGAHQAGAAAQVGPDQPLPGVDLGLGRLGETVAGQIDQHQPAAQVEHVDLLRAPGRARDARQLVAPGQRVDQARLADVRTPGKGHLGQARRRQLGEVGDAGDEGARLGEQLPPRFEERRIVQGFGRGERHHRLRPTPPCAS